MNKVLRNILIGLGVVALAGGLVLSGVWIGRWSSFGFGWPFSANNMMEGWTRPGDDSSAVSGYGMMGSRNGSGMMGNGTGYGMMGNQQGYRPGMMGGYSANSANVTPLTLDEAYQSAEQYLTKLDNSDLKIAEVMVFDNNAYVRVIEQSSGIGAFELLVDPVTGVVYPEHGPNMMWNLKYAGLNHQQMMGGRGGMMGFFSTDTTPQAVTSEMTVTAAQALQSAQKYLDSALPGTTTAKDADPFYGYYTIDILRDGKTVGMLSVNGFNSQVFLHSWHGTFIEAKDY